jgi:hypothetical protein
MANTYRAVSDRAKALHDPAEFEADLTPADERDQIEAGHLEIVPRPYKVLSNNFSAGKQGDAVDLALLVEQEAALIQGGHIERVEKPGTKPTTRKKG